ncbi:hypothetical protein [Alcaligenes faecalis]|uniref:hypothetical protein n=1 Tax=Alcaligenes faecalis TaxID=511 RepID=UPI0005AB8971|nr:hypothetical protein [Alcaligenes faecalis]ATH99128.1 hypothetical protein CPY64_05000 [Alcaligenes faecalis]AYZ91915.1 hypothetical protein EGY22_10770 [Alcaligenes faecalis]KVX05375.1 hypothetical protein ASL22_17760 [Alcaligenes faecalis]MCX5595623.1 hypothetical protein [Alcaligenes faecalis]QQC32276.1 hypothetical protein I6H81_16875 [Alcaligenes faecalis]
MNENDHRLVMTELDTLKQQVASTIQKFEATGFAAILKDDYVALHNLEHRITEMHLAYTHAIA